MPSWYIVKLSFTSKDDKGFDKKESKAYLFDAVSYTDAETRCTVAMEEYGLSNQKVTGIKPMRLTDVFEHETGENWYAVTIIYMLEDERSGKEKRIINYMVVNADTVREAYDRIQENMKSMLVPFGIESVANMNLDGVYHYEAPSEESN